LIKARRRPGSVAGLGNIEIAKLSVDGRENAMHGLQSTVEWRWRAKNYGLLERRVRSILARLIPVRLAALILVILICVGTAGANTIAVNSLNDPTTTSGNGSCSLREAIDNANSPGTDTTGGDCALGSGNDTIVFSTGVIGTITLAATLPAIANTLTIQGPAASPPAIAVSGKGRQVMVVNEAATLNLAYIAIEDGGPSGAGTGNGAGIANQGTLTVTYSTVSGNALSIHGEGGGVYNSGTLTVTRSTFSNNGAGGGGGIFSTGTLTIISSTFAGNSANSGSPGGGIYAGGTLTVTNSTFSANSAEFGGGIYNIGTLTVTNSTFTSNSAEQAGGGIDNSGTLTVTNSTLADNSAVGYGGGIYITGGTLTLINSTFAGNSAANTGGIANGGSLLNPGSLGTVDVKGTILTSSTGGNCAGPIADEGYNLSDDDSCGLTQSTSTENVTDVELNLDPGGLQSNGGPTETVAVEPGSIAINAIPVASCRYINVNPCTNPPTIASGSSGPLVCDQRGEPRPGSGESACAIGAFEPQTLTEFAEFVTGLIVFPNQFAAGGTFTLAANAPAFNPPTQAVTLTISSAAFGPLSLTIPAGSFKLVKGQYKYSGTIGGVNCGVTILAPVDGVYQFTFAAFGVDVTGITNPVSVILQIGGNIGTDDNVPAAIL
jgi:CSLREA domain-containing protein